MSSQSQLPLFPDSEAAPRHPLFLALYPDAATEARIESLALRLRKDNGLQGHPLGPERYHITLQHFGEFSEWPNPTMEQVLQAAATIALPPFEVELDRAVSFRNPAGKKAFVLLGNNATTAVNAFYAALGDALARVGVKASKTITPHLTLLYDDLEVPEQAIEPIRWTVQSFSLIRSVPRTRPALPDEKDEGHKRLATWPLAQ